MKLLLIRGLPGSGKSTMAKAMHGFCHYEADMFFVDKDGVYRFDQTQLTAAHEWCLRQATNALVDGKDCVVSNTFVKAWELTKYVELAKRLNAELEIVQATGEYQNTHNVPHQVIERMRSQFQAFDIKGLR